MFDLSRKMPGLDVSKLFGLVHFDETNEIAPQKDIFYQTF